MIKLSQALSEVIPDGSNPQELKDYIVQLKLCIEELSRKAQSLQEELRSSIPSTNDLEEGEMVRSSTYNIYTKIGGAIRCISTS